MNDRRVIVYESVEAGFKNWVNERFRFKVVHS
jgi:hypothetical protein